MIFNNAWTTSEALVMWSKHKASLFIVSIYHFNVKVLLPFIGTTCTIFNGINNNKKKNCLHWDEWKNNKKFEWKNIERKLNFFAATKLTHINVGKIWKTCCEVIGLIYEVEWLRRFFENFRDILWSLGYSLVLG